MPIDPATALALGAIPLSDDATLALEAMQRAEQDGDTEALAGYAVDAVYALVRLVIQTTEHTRRLRAEVVELAQLVEIVDGGRQAMERRAMDLDAENEALRQELARHRQQSRSG